MAITVEIGNIRGFILDDPVAGKLDNATYKLGGLSFADVTDSVYSVSIQRGKNRELARYSSGQVSVTLNNEDRRFDPIAGTVVDPLPMRDIRVTIDGERTFTGIVDDWNYAYDTDGSSKAQVVGSDVLRFLQQRFVGAGTAVQQLSGARVEAVLDLESVDWPAGERDIDAGESTLLLQVLDNETALDYLQQVELTEQGALFISKDGKLTFKSRSSFAPRSATLLKLADDGTGIPYTNAQANYGSELLYNSFTVSDANGSSTASDALSIEDFGLLSNELDILGVTSGLRSGLAEYLVARYKNPEFRFSAVVVNMDELSASDKADILALELGSMAEISFTPNGIGSPIEQFCQVIGISHDVQPDRHDVTLNLTSLDFALLVLDDAEFGKLDTYSLGY